MCLNPGMNGEKELQKIAESTTAKQNTNSAPDSGTFKFDKCTMERSGDITCTISKSEFETVSKSGVKPKRLVFEIED